MSMGQSRIEQIKDSRGNVRTNRIPAKPLNPFMKASIIMMLETRPDIFVTEKFHPGATTYVVKDGSGKELFEYENAWDYGYYVIRAGDKVIAEMDWYENDGNTNQQQQDIFDIANALRKKMDDTRRVENGIKTLTAAEQDVLNAWGIHGNTAR